MRDVGRKKQGCFLTFSNFARESAGDITRIIDVTHTTFRVYRAPIVINEDKLPSAHNILLLTGCEVHTAKYYIWVFGYT